MAEQIQWSWENIASPMEWVQQQVQNSSQKLQEALDLLSGEQIKNTPWVAGLIAQMSWLLQECLSTHSNMFEQIAACVQETCEQKQKYEFDELSGLYSKHRFNDDIKTAVEKQKPFTVIMFDLNNLKTLNDTYGHKVWDAAIQEFANVLNQIFGGQPDTNAYRRWGDEFFVISYMDTTQIQQLLSQTEQWLSKRALTVTIKWKNIRTNLNFWAWYETYTPDMDLEKFLDTVDQKMYEDKEAKKRWWSQTTQKLISLAERKKQKETTKKTDKTWPAKIIEFPA